MSELCNTEVHHAEIKEEVAKKVSESTLKGSLTNTGGVILAKERGSHEVSLNGEH